LAGAAHLLNHNAGKLQQHHSLRTPKQPTNVLFLGVLRGAHGEQKSPVEQKGKSPLDFDFQCEYKP
jgi:hypothetical protein